MRISLAKYLHSRLSRSATIGWSAVWLVASVWTFPACAEQMGGVSDQVIASENDRRRAATLEHDDEAPPVDLAAAYTFDVWRNEGGAKDGWRYLDNLDVTADVDLDRAVGWGGARAYAYLLYNNGKSLGELTGDAQVASNIETGTKAVRLFEAWIEQEFLEGASVRVGLYDINSEFDALDSSAMFIGSAHGIGTDISQSGENGPSIFPVTSLSARLQVRPTENLAVRVAVLDGIPGNPDRPGEFVSMHLGKGDGAFAIGELDWSQGDVRVLGGGWTYTERQPRLDGTGNAKSKGIYLRGEWALIENDGQSLTAFGRVGAASGDTNQFGRFVSGGVKLALDRGWELGVAFAQARTSKVFRRIEPSLKAETAFELTAANQVTDWLTIQPDIQYVVNPGAVPGVEDAVIAGMRVTLSL